MRSAAMVTLIGIVAAVAAQPPQKPRAVPPFLEEFQPGKVRDLPLFLDEFHARNDPPILTRDVRFPSAVGEVHGHWARAARAELLPAVLLAYDDVFMATWMQSNAQHLASIGYSVLAVNLHARRPAGGKALTQEAALAELSAAVRWLRSQADVAPNRLGMVGWGWSGAQALAVASATAVQACVVCDAPLPDEPSVFRGLRGTPVLAVYGGEDPRSRQELPVFAKRLRAEQVPCKLHVAAKASAGFLGPPEHKTYNHDAAEDAWVAIYNFLEKHVEDAKPAEVVAQHAKSALTIADMMRAVNEPSGVRGALSRALETQPKTARQWGQVRAQAALIAEMGAWLQTQPPPKGPAGHWQEQAQAFTTAASAIVDAAERRDYAAAQQRLARLASKCAACHNEHR